jgi:hypothetical protein
MQFDWQFMCSQDLLNYSRLPQIVYFQNTLKVPYGYFISQVYYDCRIMCIKDQSNYSGLDTSKIPPGTLMDVKLSELYCNLIPRLCASEST